MDIRTVLTDIRDTAAAALAELPPPAPTLRLVRAGENLQAALDAGGAIALEAGATFEGNFRVYWPGTRLTGGHGAAIRGIGQGAAALLVPPGARGISIGPLTVTTSGDQAVVQIGMHDASQTALDLVPDGIVLDHVTVPSHRGKRAFEVHGTNVSLLECRCRDVYDPAGRDSQGIWIGNTPGKVTVRGGVYEAGSENILVGGAGGPTPIPGVVPTDLVFDLLELSRPMAWREDGVNRKVKCLFELKSGRNVKLTRSTLSGCWVQGQVGYAIVLTPRDAGVIGNVLVENVLIEKAGGGLNMLGQDDGQYSRPVRGVTFRRVHANVSGEFGSGRFAQWGGEPVGILFDECHFESQDTAIVSYDYVVWDSPAVRGSGFVTRGVNLLNNRFAARGGYGFITNGFAFGKNWQQSWPDGVIAGNTFVGPNAKHLQVNLPPHNNQFLAE